MIQYFKAAVRGALALILLSCANVAHAEWWEAETAHFIIVSETESEDTEQFAIRLERFDNALRFLQGMPIPGLEVGSPNKVRVYRFGDTDNISQLAGNAEMGIAGFYIPRAGGAVSFVPARQNFDQRARDQRTALTPEGVLFHEYVHHFMLQNFSTSYPHWYREGFAELYGTIELLENGAFKVGNVPQHRGTALFELPDIRLSRLLDHNAKLTNLEYYQAYSYGWLLSHYLNFNQKRQGQLTRYLKELNAGEDSLTAAKAAFGDIDQLQKEVYKYRDGPFPGYEVKPANYVAPKVTMRRLSKAEEELMRYHVQTRRGVTPRRARSVMSDVEDKELAAPDNLPVQLMVGEAYLDARSFEKAEATLKRAIALDPESSEAHYLMGALFVARGDDDKALYAQARPWFAKAMKFDRKDPRPAIGYYLSYYKAQEPIPEPAIIALEQAFEFSAYDNEYRMILARQLLDERKGKLARSVLAPIAFSAHKQSKENKIATIIEQIDADKIDDARATIAAVFAEQEKEAKKGS